MDLKITVEPQYHCDNCAKIVHTLLFPVVLPISDKNVDNEFLVVMMCCDCACACMSHYVERMPYRHLQVAGKLN